MENYKIKKIKIIESLHKIKIDFTNTKATGEDDLQGTFSEEAAPEFYEAMKALTESAANILEAPELATRLVPFAVTYHYSKDGTMGAIISSRLLLPGSKGETVVNTPMRKCRMDETAPGAFLTPTTAKRLWTLELEARKYLHGKRAQTNLFGGEEENVTQQEQARVIPFNGEAAQGA